MPDFPMDPSDLADLIDIPLESWPGNCHGIAEAVLRRAPVAGMRLVRGHFEGHVHRESVYRGGVQQHSWLELEDGRILDPTRWAMTRPNRPFIYLGENDDYDEGGLMLRAKGRPAAYASAFLSGQTMTGPQEMILRKLAAQDIEDVRDMFRAGGLPDPGSDLTKVDADRLNDRIMYPVEHFLTPEPFFQGLRDMGLAALVPLDSMVRVLEPEKVTVDRGANLLYEVEPAPEMTDHQRLFKIFCRFLSIEHRELHIENELEELGYKLDELHDFLNDFERSLKYQPEDPYLSYSDRSNLAVIAGDLLGKGFGVDLEVERYAKSIGLGRQDLHRVLVDFGERAGYDLPWLMPDEVITVVLESRHEEPSPV
ncbi:hypothetical protein [Pseudosulfitobacter pseudonitzschiae]|uniref:hypothetical protein n=1 Tax=Pseudosulfitobacter pseudonitzschiae TaxID=1402135 RepID=UPI003B78FE6F